MKLKQTLLGVGLTLLMVGGFYGYAGGQPLTVQINESQLEAALDPHFPLHKDLMLGVAGLDVDLTDVRLQAGMDRVEVLLSGQVEAAGKRFQGKARVSFGLDYAADTSALLLVRPEVEAFAFEGLPESLARPVTDLLLPLLQSRLERLAVYQLQDQSALEGMLRKSLKKIEIQDGKLLLTLGW